MVHWAQYMDVFPTEDQIGLVDFHGNPRPAWWAFKWFADLPVERVVNTSSTSQLTTPPPRPCRTQNQHCFHLDYRRMLISHAADQQ